MLSVDSFTWTIPSIPALLVRSKVLAEESTSSTCHCCSQPTSPSIAFAAVPPPVSDLQLRRHLPVAMLPLHEIDDEDLIVAVTAAFDRLIEPTKRALAAMDQRMAVGKTAAEISHEVTPQNWPKVFPLVVEMLWNDSKRMSAFVKCCPGLEALSAEDRNTLAQRALYGVLMLIKAPLYENGESHILLGDGTCLTRDWLRVSLKEEWIEAEHQHSRRQNELNLTVTELAITCLLYILTYGSHNVVDTDTLEQIRKRYADLLTFHVGQSRVDVRQTLNEIESTLENLAAMTRRHEADIFTSFFRAGDNPHASDLRFPHDGTGLACGS